jgi:hypothetical protein
MNLARCMGCCAQPAEQRSRSVPDSPRERSAGIGILGGHGKVLYAIAIEVSHLDTGERSRKLIPDWKSEGLFRKQSLFPLPVDKGEQSIAEAGFVGRCRRLRRQKAGWKNCFFMTDISTQRKRSAASRLFLCLLIEASNEWLRWNCSLACYATTVLSN